MSLRKKVAITIDGYNSILSKKIQLFENDIVLLEFVIGENYLNNKNGKYERVEFSPTNASLIIDNPTTSDTIEVAKVDGTKISFKLTENHTKHIGITNVMIILTDEDGCNIAIPSFEIEIRQRLSGVVVNIATLKDSLGNIIKDSYGRILRVRR